MRYIIIPLLLALVSCGARKVETSKVEEIAKVDSSVVIKIDGTHVAKTNVHIEETAEEIEYKPLDSLKPMVVNGKEYNNTIIKIKRHNKKLLDTSSVESTLKVNKKVNLKKEDKKRIKTKSTKKSPNYWMYLWFLVPVVIIWLLEKYGKMLLPNFR
jgi:hypothetical protein